MAVGFDVLGLVAAVRLEEDCSRTKITGEGCTSESSECTLYRSLSLPDGTPVCKAMRAVGDI